MSSFRLRFPRHGIIIPTLLPDVYNANFGHYALLSGGPGGSAALADAYTRKGWIDFGKRSGTTDVFIDPGASGDTGDGLSWANRKQTWKAGCTVWKNLPDATRGRILLAGMDGRFVTDFADNGWWRDLGGYSAAYPQAVLGINPYAPTDETQYGKLLGADRPRIRYANNADGAVHFLDAAGNTGTDNYAVQGVILERNPSDTNCGTFVFHGPHDNLCLQNVLLNEVGLDLQGLDDANRAFNTLLSKIAVCNVWSTTTSTGAFLAELNGYAVEDYAFIHCGWRPGFDRNNADNNGGPSFFNHDSYDQAHNINGVYRRGCHLDSANDALNIRGEGSANRIWVLDVPIAFTLGGTSTTRDENPDGGLITLDDAVVTGGARIDDGLQRNWLLNTRNTVSGSHLRNVVAHDSPYATDTSARFVDSGHQDSNGFDYYIDNYMLLDKVRSRNWNTSGVIQTLSGGDTSKTHISYNDCVGDLFGGTPDLTNYKTRAQMLTAMGFDAANYANYAAQKAALENAVATRPDFAWAAAANTVGLPILGLSSQYELASVPSMSGITPLSIF